MLAQTMTSSARPVFGHILTGHLDRPTSGLEINPLTELLAWYSNVAKSLELDTFLGSKQQGKEFGRDKF